MKHRPSTTRTAPDRTPKVREHRKPTPRTAIVGGVGTLLGMLR